MRWACLHGLLLCVAATLAYAADAPGPEQARAPSHLRVRPPAPLATYRPYVPLVPDCEEVETRLLRCAPREYVSPDTLDVLQARDVLPITRSAPYPQLYSRPYGSF